ncbi:MAG: non-heme iron oxygenase ferredoxin subunit [Nocardioidaceae bacterium]|nr:non-heme iron oxygenase ferredoxin subunit [Nocardioidaceae bacterium]
MTFEHACALDAVPAGGVLAVDVAGTEVAIVRTDDEVFAIHDVCSHAAIALSEGDVDTEACEIECWLHGSRFDLRSGKPTGLPAYEPVPVYPCKVEGDAVVVDVAHPINETEL